MDGTDEPAAAAASVEGEMESVVPNSELAGLLTTEARTYCRAMFNRLVAIGGGGTTIQSSMFALHDQEVNSTTALPQQQQQQQQK